MARFSRIGRVGALIAAAVMTCLALGACAKSVKDDSASMSKGSDSSMAGMNMGPTTKAVDGVKPIPTQVLASADWQGMKITARTMTAAPFVIFNGTTEHLVKVSKSTSFHLMVDLTDQHTGVAIPYATVWATIKKNGKTVYNDQQWPMLSAYMGPHYGNDVSLPGAGKYTLDLLVTPPIAARHLEYKNVWLKPHTVKTSFTWTDPS